jgi:hypothetical protein
VTVGMGVTSLGGRLGGERRSASRRTDNQLAQVLAARLDRSWMSYALTIRSRQGTWDWLSLHTAMAFSSNILCSTAYRLGSPVSFARNPRKVIDDRSP